MVAVGARSMVRSSLLSVLALSSRFDGRLAIHSSMFGSSPFQYSLCRVVLMVSESFRVRRAGIGLSVLALSSRFDGHR